MGEVVGPRDQEVVLEGWGALNAVQRREWWNSLLTVLPEWRVTSEYGDPWAKWTNPRGLWILRAELNDRGPRHLLTLQRNQSTWHLEDFAIPHVLLVLRVLGAIE